MVMENLFPTPSIVVSKCLGFAACRWNGAVIPDRFLERLKEHAELVPVCPEMEIGLGVPRDPIRIVVEDGEERLLQPNTGRDVTAEMNRFSREYVGALEEVDGFILKDRSPSCGTKGVKAYTSTGELADKSKRAGFFARKVRERHPRIPIETEGRMMNYTLREHFLVQVYTLARFRLLRTSPAMKDLVQFHANHKLLLMAYDQERLRRMGRIVANHEKAATEIVFRMYEDSLYDALQRIPRYTTHINVLLHALGYFSKQLSAREKRFFLDTLEEYHTQRLPFSVPVSLIRSYIVRYEEPYLSKQFYFHSYPSDLADITDSGKGRRFNR
jgi:uncharacterized protein YbgA (DUF1722 family)/uncharacterized protein YbbK (DUF523 family)